MGDSNTVEIHEDDYVVGETSDRWNTLNTKENTTMKEWHDTQKAAESIVKKLDTYYLNILKQKIADYSHFTIEEFHELASELLIIQCAEEEKIVEQKRKKELEEEREFEGFKIEDSIKIQVGEDRVVFTNTNTSKGFSLPLYSEQYSLPTVKDFIENLKDTQEGR